MFEVEQQISMSLERAARFDPFRPVHWRWDLAQQIASGQIPNPGPITSRLKSAVDYLRRRAAGEPLLDETDSAITDALELFETDSPFRWKLEARLLAGESDQEISQKMGVSVETTATFEWLFFAVRNCRRATGYLLGAVVKYAHFRGFRNHEVREFWAWCAMAGGPLIVDLMVQIFHKARQEGEPPNLKGYLRRGACDLMIQDFIALQVLPPEANAPWLFNLSTKLRAAKTSARPIAETNKIYRALVRCAREFLKTTKVPQPPGWWNATNLSSVNPGGKTSPTKKSKDEQSTARSGRLKRQPEESIGS